MIFRELDVDEYLERARLRLLKLGEMTYNVCELK